MAYKFSEDFFYLRIWKRANIEFLKSIQEYSVRFIGICFKKNITPVHRRKFPSKFIQAIWPYILKLYYRRFIVFYLCLSLHAKIYQSGRLFQLLLDLVCDAAKLVINKSTIVEDSMVILVAKNIVFIHPLVLISISICF